MNVVYLYEDLNITGSDVIYEEKVLYTCPPGKISKILTGPTGRGKKGIACANYDRRNNSSGNIELKIGEDVIILSGHSNNTHFFIGPFSAPYFNKISDGYGSIKSEICSKGWAVFTGLVLGDSRVNTDLVLFPGESISIRSQNQEYHGQVVVNMKIIEDDLNLVLSSS